MYNVNVAFLSPLSYRNTISATVRLLSTMAGKVTDEVHTYSSILYKILLTHSGMRWQRIALFINSLYVLFREEGTCLSLATNIRTDILNNSSYVRPVGAPYNFRKDFRLS